MVDVAEIKLWGTLVGAVRWDAQNQLASFQYSPAFLKKEWDISPIKMPITEVMEMAIVFGAIVLVMKIVTDTATRHKLIRAGLVDEKIKFLYNANPRLKPLNNIKWGMILVGIGMGIKMR